MICDAGQFRGATDEDKLSRRIQCSEQILGNDLRRIVSEASGAVANSVASWTCFKAMAPPRTYDLGVLVDKASTSPTGRAIFV